MKRISTLFLSVSVLFSCKNGWSDQDRKQFVGGCVNGAIKSMKPEKANAYCQCMLQKIQQRYPSPVNSTFMKNDTAVYRIGKECFITSQ